MTLLYDEYVIFTLISIVIFSVYMAVIALTRRDPVRERLQRVVPVSAQETGYAHTESKSAVLIFCSNLLAMSGIDIVQLRRSLYLPLARAGLLSNEAAVYCMFARRFIQPAFIVLCIIVLLRGILLDQISTGGRLVHVIIAGVLLLIGMRGMQLYIDNCTAKRKARLQRSFPDALDLLLVCVESGLPLDGALMRVCREMKKLHPEIIQELDRTRIELNVLNNRIQALQNLADRTDTHGFKTLVSALIQTEKVGSSIADTMRVLADEYRITRMLNAENKAARIPALITLPLILFILPAFMLVIMGPVIVRIKDQGGMLPDTSASQMSR